MSEPTLSEMEAVKFLMQAGIKITEVKARLHALSSEAKERIKADSLFISTQLALLQEELNA
jgi:hypothetical protein